MIEGFVEVVYQQWVDETCPRSKDVLCYEFSPQTGLIDPAFPKMAKGQVMCLRNDGKRDSYAAVIYRDTGSWHRCNGWLGAGHGLVQLA